MNYNPPLDNPFSFIAYWLKVFLDQLDFQFFDGISFLDLIIGFIALSAIISVFWKGIRG